MGFGGGQGLAIILETALVSARPNTPCPPGDRACRTTRRADIDAFVDMSGDHQGIHVDREPAAAGPFEVIIRGFVTSRSTVILDGRRRLDAGQLRPQTGPLPRRVPVGPEHGGGLGRSRSSPQASKLCPRVVIKIREARRSLASIVDYAVVSIREHRGAVNVSTTVT
jgi:hypothetical protein